MSAWLQFQFCHELTCVINHVIEVALLKVLGLSLLICRGETICSSSGDLQGYYGSLYQTLDQGCRLINSFYEADLIATQKRRLQNYSTTCYKVVEANWKTKCKVRVRVWHFCDLVQLRYGIFLKVDTGTNLGMHVTTWWPQLRRILRNVQEKKICAMSRLIQSINLQIIVYSFLDI